MYPENTKSLLFDTLWNLNERTIENEEKKYVIFFFKKKKTINLFDINSWPDTINEFQHSSTKTLLCVGTHCIQQCIQTYSYKFSSMNLRAQTMCAPDILNETTIVLIKYVCFLFWFLKGSIAACTLHTNVFSTKSVNRCAFGCWASFLFFYFPYGWLPQENQKLKLQLAHFSFKQMHAHKHTHAHTFTHTSWLKMCSVNFVEWCTFMKSSCLSFSFCLIKMHIYMQYTTVGMVVVFFVYSFVHHHCHWILFTFWSEENWCVCCSCAVAAIATAVTIAVVAARKSLTSLHCRQKHSYMRLLS